MWLWTNDVISLNLSFLICEIGLIIYLLYSTTVGIKGVSLCKARKCLLICLFIFPSSFKEPCKASGIQSNVQLQLQPVLPAVPELLRPVGLWPEHRQLQLQLPPVRLHPEHHAGKRDLASLAPHPLETWVSLQDGVVKDRSSCFRKTGNDEAA